MLTSIPRPARHVSALLVALLLAVPSVAGAAGQRSTPVASLLRAALPRLRASRIPVYLPSWLPRYHGREYVKVTLTDHRRAFQVELCGDPACRGDASIELFLSGVIRPADLVGRRIALGHGRFGRLDPHTGGNEGPTLSWQNRRFSYEIGYLPSVHDLIRAARSVVLVR